MTLTSSVHAALAVLALSLGAACGGPPSAAEPAAAARSAAAAEQKSSHASARRLLFAADALHATLIQAFGPVDGWLALTTEDVIYLGPDAGIVRGRGAVRAALVAGQPVGARISVKRTLAGGDLSADGSFGFTFGWFEQTARAADGSVAVTHGTYTACWRRVGALFLVEADLAKVYPLAHDPVREGFPLLVSGPGAQGTPRPGEVADLRAGLLDADRQFEADSLAEGYSQAFVDHAAPFAMPIGGKNFYFLEGAPEIAAFYAGWTPAETLAWTPRFAGTGASGDLGYTAGTSDDAYTNPDGSVDHYYGTYLTLWRRESGGGWRWIADGGNDSPPPSP
jgi:ketosteroid isomerase-like protein